jgi:hypothetical protein
MCVIKQQSAPADKNNPFTLRSYFYESETIISAETSSGIQIILQPLSPLRHLTYAFARVLL